MIYRANKNISTSGRRQYSVELSPPPQRRLLRSSSADSGIPCEEEEDLLPGLGGEGVLENTADNLQDIVKLRAEMADTFLHTSGHDLDMFSDLTDSDIATSLKGEASQYTINRATPIYAIYLCL